jgi:hypothetical protein
VALRTEYDQVAREINMVFLSHVTSRLAILLVPTVLLGHPSQEPPTFRSAVRAIDVDVRVTKDGDAVRDLTKDDFEVLEDGVVQAITHVSFTELAGAIRPLRDDGTFDPASNAPEGRTVVLMLGARSERLWEVARLFLERGIGPGDRVAVLSTLQTATPRLNFTSSGEEMIAAVRYITRGTGTARPQDLPPADLRGLRSRQ